MIMLDLLFLLPVMVTRAQDIPKTIIYMNEIKCIQAAVKLYSSINRPLKMNSANYENILKLPSPRTTLLLKYAPNPI
jgi:hypothetical protein